MKKRRYSRDELGRFAEVKAKPRLRKPVKKAPVKAKPPLRKPVKKAPVTAKPPLRKLTRKPPVKAKPPLKKPTRKPPVKAKPPLRKPVKKAPVKAKPPLRKPTRKPPVKAKPPLRKPTRKAPAKAKPPLRKPIRKPPVKAKPPLRKPTRKPPVKAKPPVRKRKPAKAPVPVPVKKKRRKGRKKFYRDEHGHFIEKPAPESPLVAERSIAAESLMQARLMELLDLVSLVEPGLDMSVQTMANEDGTVDGELRISNLPGDWREPGGAAMMAAVLSSAFRTWDLFPAKPPMGGAYWVTFGVRFGPQNEAEVGELAELYKRFRGLFQVGTYPTPAWISGSIQVALTTDNTSLKSMVRSIVEKRGYPPSVLLVRFVWTPDSSRPGHYKGEK